MIKNAKMSSKIAVALTLLLMANLGFAIQKDFNFFSCYPPDTDVSDRAPNTLETLLNVLDNYTPYDSVPLMAEMLVRRYRTDGIIFNGDVFRLDGIEEIQKQEFVQKLTWSQMTLNTDNIDQGKECALFFMISHSIDDYPFPGINDTWRQLNYNRFRRQTKPKQNKNKVKQNKIPVSKTGNKKTVMKNTLIRSAYSHNDGFAKHPIENGVMNTPYGPVALGTLLTGLMSLQNNRIHTVEEIVGREEALELPNEMKNKKLIPEYAATLAGDMAEMALSSMDMEIEPTDVGPTGRWQDTSTCCSQFSLQSRIPVTTMTRAEINAGLDAMIIAKAFREDNTSMGRLSLSQLLRLYYSERGLPRRENYRACNRTNLYQELDTNLLKEQALNIMYAYQTTHFYTVAKQVQIQKDQFSKIESHFKDYLGQVSAIMESYISGFPYTDYPACVFSSNSTDNEIPRGETEADVIFVYADKGSQQLNQQTRQIIGEVYRSQSRDFKKVNVGILNSQGYWIRKPQVIGDISQWACDIIQDDPWDGGSVDALSILDTLRSHYQNITGELYSNEKNSVWKSQLVIWLIDQPPSGIKYQDQTQDMDKYYGYNQYAGDTNQNNIINRTWRRFKLHHPYIRMLYVGNNTNSWKYLLAYEDDTISTLNEQQLKPIVDEISDQVQVSPRTFVYPRCDPSNGTYLKPVQNYDESSHVYTGSISPFHSTFIIISPELFRYSDDVKFRITQGRGVVLCGSRTNRFALNNYRTNSNNNFWLINPNDDEILCTNDTSQEIEFVEPCDRYLETCNPIFLSITAVTDEPSCYENPACTYPTQVLYKLSHEGLTCGCQALLPPSLLVLLLVAYKALC